MGRLCVCVSVCVWVRALGAHRRLAGRQFAAIRLANYVAGVLS